VKNKIVIGGEHNFSIGFLFRRSIGYIDNLIYEFKNDYHINFTFGGYHSLLAIIDDIKPRFDDNSIVLLPSYLCPSMLIPFKKRQIKYKFYKVNSELFVDTEHLASCLNNDVKAVLFIDYFGASQKEHLNDILKILRDRDIKIIQDLVQCVNIQKEQLIGDYMYNSFRKYLPFEGSLLLSKTKMKIDFINPSHKYLINKRLGQLLRYYHLKYHVFSSSIFLKLFKKAEENYNSEKIARVPSFNKKMLNKIDIEKFLANQKYYHTKLNSDFGILSPKLLQQKNYIPLGFVIKISDRDQIRQSLFADNIYPPIHWILSDEINKQVYNESVTLSSSILTIPIFNMDELKYNYLLPKLKKYLQ